MRNVLELRKPKHKGFPQAGWILGDLINIYIELDPLGYAQEITNALEVLESQLGPDLTNARYLFWFHQLDAASNQDRDKDALRIAYRIRDAALADPIPSTGEHYLVNCYRFFCSHFAHRKKWSKLATFANAGEAVAREQGQKQSLATFLMWQAVLNQQKGDSDTAARLYRSAMSRKRRLKTAHAGHFVSAMSTYHELRGNLKIPLQLIADDIRDCMALGKKLRRVEFTACVT